MRDPIKLIFLDVDGVLNNPGCYAKASGTHAPPAPECITALNRITDTTGALIVISSTWRLQGLMFCKDVFSSWGVTGKVLGATPSSRQPNELSRPRGCEIIAWLRDFNRYSVEAYVILDDDNDMGAVLDHLIQTDGSRGLSEADADRAIHFLTAGVLSSNQQSVKEKNKPT